MRKPTSNWTSNSNVWTWSSNGEDFDTTIWYGEASPPEFLDPDTTPWQELYEYEDFVGIAQQIQAEELGYA